MSKIIVLFFFLIIWLPYIRVNTVQLPRPNLDARAEMGLSVDWHRLSMELFWLKLCSNSSRRRWIRLWPAGLNWYFRLKQIFLISTVLFASCRNELKLTSMKMCAQRKAGWRHPFHGPLRFITSHSRFALARTIQKTKRLRRRLGLQCTLACFWLACQFNFTFLTKIKIKEKKIYKKGLFPETSLKAMSFGSPWHVFLF